MESRQAASCLKVRLRLRVYVQALMCAHYPPPVSPLLSSPLPRGSDGATGSSACSAADHHSFSLQVDTLGLNENTDTRCVATIRCVCLFDRAI